MKTTNNTTPAPELAQFGLLAAFFAWIDRNPPHIVGPAVADGCRPLLFCINLQFYNNFVNYRLYN